LAFRASGSVGGLHLRGDRGREDFDISRGRALRGPAIGLEEGWGPLRTVLRGLFGWAEDGPQGDGERTLVHRFLYSGNSGRAHGMFPQSVIEKIGRGIFARPNGKVKQRRGRFYMAAAFFGAASFAEAGSASRFVRGSTRPSLAAGVSWAEAFEAPQG